MRVSQKATMVAIEVGVIGLLALGGGIGLSIKASGIFFWLGIIVGMIGLGVCGLAFPIYQKTLKKERAQIADEIVKLSKEVRGE